jgi:hypothetical protein
MKRTLILLAWLASASAAAYPIPPQNIWTLSGSAEVIVIAKVSVQGGPKHSVGGAEIARLSVQTVLKGSPPAELDVVTESNVLCPAPGRFIDGRMVIAFLFSAGGKWHVQGRSYGTLYPQPEELAVYKARISEAVKLQAREHSLLEKVDWAVRATARRATRWDGTSVLPLPRRVPKPRTDGKPGSEEWSLIDPRQRKMIADGFIAEPSADATTARIADALQGYSDAAVDRALVGAIDTLLLEGRADAAYDAINSVIMRAGGDLKLLAGLDPYDLRNQLGALREAWTRVLDTLKLPAGVKVSRPKIEPGTGADAPL